MTFILWNFDRTMTELELNGGFQQYLRLSRDQFSHIITLSDLISRRKIQTGENLTTKKEHWLFVSGHFHDV